MTNYEKNKELLDMYGVANVSWGADKDGKVFECYGNRCGDCIFDTHDICPQKRLQWLQQEYKEEPEVDWSKVPIDTPILVRDNEGSRWTKRNFAGYFFGKVFAFNNGRTSKDYSSLICWGYAKLAEEDDEE